MSPRKPIGNYPFSHQENFIGSPNKSSTAGPSRSRPAPPPPINLTVHNEPGEDDDDNLEEDDDEAIRRAEEKVCQMKARKAAAAAKKKAEEEAARKAAEEAQRQKEAAARELEEHRRIMAAAATARSQRGSSPGETSASIRRPVVEIRQRKEKAKNKAKTKAQPVGEDPDDGGDGDDDDDDKDDRAPCERCRSKKISCQMQAGKRSSVICKPCHDAKVRCSYSGRPSTVKREGGGNPSNECLAVLESQVAQLLADNWQLRDGQVKANTYHRHMNRKLDWLVMDARRRRTPPELPEAGPSGLSKKRRRLVDSNEEEEQGRVEEKVGEEDGEGEREEERDEPAPKKARTEKGKERAE
ncbi:hypothetical protein F5879DRAFT_996270 [Lentinula edodes]|nr:hypothetical protein F5879DRAFT_996270 [Lentinula edodes]